MRLLTPCLIAVATLLAACAQPSPQAVATHDSELRAIIQTIDPVNREILLRADDGRVVSVVAGPDVANFDQLRPGDFVEAMFFESIAARMAAPGQELVTLAGGAEDRAAPGERPGAAMGMAIEAVVRWVGFDPDTGLSTFTGASGLTHSVLTPTEMQAFAAARREGDTVLIEYTAAMAVDVTPVSPGN